MPYILKNHPDALPTGYAIIRMHAPDAASYLLVYCVATGRYVGEARHYRTTRAAVLAAKRSAFMVRYNAICQAA